MLEAAVKYYVSRRPVRAVKKCCTGQVLFFFFPRGMGWWSRGSEKILIQNKGSHKQRWSWLGHINTATPYPTPDVEGKLCSSGLRRLEVELEGIWEVDKSTWSGREAQGKSWQMPLLVEMRNRIKKKEKSTSFLLGSLASDTKYPRPCFHAFPPMVDCEPK